MLTHQYDQDDHDHDDLDSEGSVSIRDTAVLVSDVGGIGGSKAQNRIFLNNFLGDGNSSTTSSDSEDESEEKAPKNPMFPQLY